ncbi:MAG: hypothetical protein V3U29_02370 [Phycisphaeraceae bacterium]
MLIDVMVVLLLEPTIVVEPLAPTVPLPTEPPTGADEPLGPDCWVMEVLAWMACMIVSL